ncbi:uncharacterized protein LOC127427311 [Myxocyprinus asiaticus]|uniref:uncharacterized protein LOC127427311 n=1 Tax=Myxocyprinus asiaticus TaxID=70543 RepID=UPI002223C470|nr:uncharacterized protein LOC127427311 [Myxocyprinus asiaticus]
MIKSQEQDELIAVRVQDPRIQNKGSWNSYVDFKIFLHTNSKAFTAKTSCVRRQYSEFVWLKKKLQKNAGLVPVPDLPKKSLFSFINDDFIERRRKGLQSFLDKVLHMTVCLSDSQLHLFLQTQLPVKHIEDCVQGHTPYTVTEAILTYASSNCGWVQEEGSGAQELWPAPAPYESVESPAPPLPTLQCAGATSSGLVTPNELYDVSDLETESRLSEVEQTAPVLKDGKGHEQIVQEKESSINLEFEVHPTTLLNSVETDLEVENSGSKETQWLDKKSKDLQGNGCEYTVPQSTGLLEDKSWQGDTHSQGEGLDKVLDQETSVEITSVDRVIEKRTPGAINDGKRDSQDAACKQECTVRQTLDKDLLEEDLSVRVHYNEVTLDLSVAKDTAEQSDHRGQELVETVAKTREVHELNDVDSVMKENTPYNNDQEQGKAEITVDEAVNENGVCDEDFNIDASVKEEATLRQTLDKDLHGKGSVVHYNVVTLDLSANHSDQMLVENTTKIEKDVPLLDCHVASIFEEILPHTKDQEQGKAEITEDDAVQENSVSDEDSSIDDAVQEEAMNEKQRHVGEVNKLNAKCVQTESGILKLGGIEKAAITQNAPMTGNVQNDSTEESYEDSNLVLQAIETDLIQCQEKDSHLVLYTHQPDAN